MTLIANGLTLLGWVGLLSLATITIFMAVSEHRASGSSDQ